jgi:hypothetical protein
MDKIKLELTATGFDRNIDKRIDLWHSEIQNKKYLHLYDDFDYYFNNYGFRSINEENYYLDDDNDIWCFGCSFTAGIGVSRQNCWPAIVEKSTNRPVKNFGVPGAGPRNAWRLIRAWYESVDVKPKHIFVFGFFPGRDEVPLEDEKTGNMFYEQTQRKVKTYDNIDTEKMYKDVISKIKKYNNVTYLNIRHEVDDAIEHGYLDMGRDMPEDSSVYGHPGPIFHKKIADKFIKNL